MNDPKETIILPIFPKFLKDSLITKPHLFQINFYDISSLLTEKDTVQVML